MKKKKGFLWFKPKIKHTAAKHKSKKHKKPKPKIKKIKHIVKYKPKQIYRPKEIKIKEIKQPKPNLKKKKGFLWFKPKAEHKEVNNTKPKEIMSKEIKQQLKRIEERKDVNKDIKIKELKHEAKHKIKEIKIKEVKHPKVKLAKKISLQFNDGHKKLRTGIAGFDKLFKKGMLAGGSILVEGGPGSGKTIFCLQTAYNACKNGMKVLYMSFEEPEKRLEYHMSNFGWEYEKYQKSGKFMIKRFNALDIARSVEALLSEAKRELLIDIQPVLIPKDFHPDIVCIDSLSSIASAFSGEESRFRIYMEQLFRYLEAHNITSFLIRETVNPAHTGAISMEKGEAVSFLSDGIIIVYNVIYSTGKRDRAIEVLKMRGEDIDRRIVKAEIIDKKGFVVYDKMLTGEYKLT